MSMKLQKALAAGKLVVRNNTAGEVMVQIFRPDPKRPGKSMMNPIIVPATREKELTREASPEELRRSPNLNLMVSAPYNVLDVL